MAESSFTANSIQDSGCLLGSWLSVEDHFAEPGSPLRASGKRPEAQTLDAFHCLPSGSSPHKRKYGQRTLSTSECDASSAKCETSPIYARSWTVDEASIHRSSSPQSSPASSTPSTPSSSTHFVNDAQSMVDKCHNERDRFFNLFADENFTSCSPKLEPSVASNERPRQLSSVDTVTRTKKRIKSLSCFSSFLEENACDNCLNAATLQILEVSYTHLFAAAIGSAIGFSLGYSAGARYREQTAR